MIITDPAHYQDGKAVSFSWLKRLEADPEMYYRRFVLGEKPDADDEEEESRALKVGTAAHCLILEGPQVFAERFVIHPPTYRDKAGEEKRWNRNAKVCELWEDAQVESGRRVVKPEDFRILAKMREAVAANPYATRLLASGVAEHAIRRETPSLGFARQGRIDWLNLEAGALVDIKTIQNLNDRARDREQRKYHRQLSYYCDLAEEEYSTVEPYIIWLEKQWPYRCAVEKLTIDLAEIGRQENTASLMRLAEYHAGTRPWPRTPDLAEIGPSAEMIWRTQMEAANVE